MVDPGRGSPAVGVSPRSVASARCLEIARFSACSVARAAASIALAPDAMPSRRASSGARSSQATTWASRPSSLSTRAHDGVNSSCGTKTRRPVDHRLDDAEDPVARDRPPDDPAALEREVHLELVGVGKRQHREQPDALVARLTERAPVPVRRSRRPVVRR